MPNDNKQNGNSQTVPTVPVDMGDTPPMVTDIKASTPTTPIDTNPTGTSAPVSDILNPATTQQDMPIISTTSPKKKFAGGKIIATILGLFLLVGGIGAGVYLTGQNQNPQEKAAGTDCTPRSYFNTVLTDANGDNAGSCQTTTLTFDTAGIACDGSGITCNQYLDQLTQSTGVQKVFDGCFADTAACVNPNGQAATFRFFFDGTKCISTNHRYNSQDIDVDDINHKTCLQSLAQYQPNAKQVCYGSKPSCQADNGLLSGAACQNIKAYNSTWTLLTLAELQSLKSGDSVNFCATGVASTGSFDKARFTVSGVLQPETTAKRPNSNDYCQSVGITSLTTSVKVTAELHHVTLGWK